MFFFPFPLFFNVGQYLALFIGGQACAAFAQKCGAEGEVVDCLDIRTRGKEVGKKSNSGGIVTLFEQSVDLVTERRTVWAVV